MFTSSTFGHHAKKWLIGVGIFELVLAAAFVVGAFTIPFVGEGFMLTAVILGATGIVLVAIGLKVGKSAAETDRILTTGIAGTATITGLSQTGMTLNDQPQIAMDLLVQLPDRAPYAVARKEFVPFLHLARLTSGAPLAVRVDRDDPQRVIIDWSGAPAVAPMMSAAGWPTTSSAPQPATAFAPQFVSSVTGAPSAPSMAGAPTQPSMPGVPPPPPMPGAFMAGASAMSGGGVDESMAQVQAALASSGMPAAAVYAQADQGNVTTEQLRAHLRTHGLPASAVIDKLSDTGQIVGNERLYTMQVVLEMPGQPPRRLNPSAAMVPLAAISKVRLGARVPVRVAAENPSLLMFEWDKL